MELRHHRPGSRRDQRQRTVSRLRSEGRYGPTFWQVAPAFAGLIVAVAVPLVALVLLGHWAGWWAPPLLLAVLGAGWLRLRRRPARPTEAATVQLAVDVAAPELELATVPLADMPAAPPIPARLVRLPEWEVADLVEATEVQYRAAVAALLDRDGWPVREIPVGQQVHLVGTHQDGTRIGVACFRPDPEDAGASGSGSLRLVAGPEPVSMDGTLYVMVSTSRFSRDTVRWAPRHGVHLLDRPLLERWLAGEPLTEVLGLEPVAEAR